MDPLADEKLTQLVMKYAESFIGKLKLGAGIEQKCEWSCLLWSKDHWAFEARKATVALQQTKEQSGKSVADAKSIEALSSDTQFLNTVAQVYARLLDGTQQSCSVKDFPHCPFMDQRADLLRKGGLAGVFVTILHKATFYAMLDRHPIDSGLIHEEYSDVYGINLSDYSDLEKSLTDGRFERLYQEVLKRASQLAGIPQQPVV